MLTYEEYLFYFQHSATVKLLRSNNAPLILSFFQKAFKSNEKLTIPYEDLKSLLIYHLEDINRAYPGSYMQSAQEYIEDWCNDKLRLLRKYYEVNNDEPLVELTYDSERGLEWFESLKKKDFVGTESRFMMIFQGLKEIAEKVDVDPVKKLQELTLKKLAIDQEIADIEKYGVVDQLNSTQIKERFSNIIDQSRRLVSDFRMVEDNFRNITKEVKENKLRYSKSKGQILGGVLDSSDSLDMSDQGRSFQAFWEFLMSDSRQKDLHDLTMIVLENPVVKEMLQKEGGDQGQSLKKLKTNLHLAGQKVQSSVHRLSDEIKSLLQEKNQLESKKVIQLMDDIKKLALELKDSNLFKNELIELAQLKPIVSLVIEKPLWTLPSIVKFETPPIGEGNSLMTDEALASLVKQFYIDKVQLRQRILSLMKDRDALHLEDYLNYFPVKQGLAEVVACLDITAEDKHLISDSKKIKIKVNPYEGTDGVLFHVELPEIVFVKKGK